MSAITLVEVKDRPRTKKVNGIPLGGWGYSFPPKAFGDLRREISPLDLVRLKPLREKLTQAIDSTIKDKCPQIPEETRRDTARQITEEVLRYAPGEFNTKFANWAVDRAERYTFLALEQLKAVGRYTAEKRELTPEEEIVEREIRRSLRDTPEEYSEDKGAATSSPDVTPLSTPKLSELTTTESPLGKPKKLSAYLIRKELLARDRCYNGWHCGLCHKRRKSSELKAIRVSKNGDSHSVSDYVLMCGICREKRAQKQKVRLVYGGGFELKDETKLSKSAFYSRIRAEVLERDHHKCCYCGEKPNGIAPIRPLSKGGELSIDNYVAACQKCRCSKGNDLPLDFFIRRDGYYWDQVVDDSSGTIKAGRGMIPIDAYYLAEAMQEMSKIVADKNQPRELRNKFERIVIKLGETDEDRAREVRQELKDPLF